MSKSGKSNIFAKLWNWIKSTAWIQPLLIVGIIFGVIFSIPAITKAIQDGQTKRDSAKTYYAKYQLSLKGGDKSPAQKFVNNYFEEIPLDGQKFFLVFVAEDCKACNEAQSGFQTLAKRFSKDQLGGNAFALKTIFTDEKTDEELSTTPFINFLTYADNVDFFTKAAEVSKLSAYYEKNYLGKGSYAEADAVLASISDGTQPASMFQTPTIFLIDFTKEAVAASRQGVVEAFVGVPGTTSYEKAQFLADAWNGAGKFAE